MEIKVATKLSKLLVISINDLNGAFAGIKVLVLESPSDPVLKLLPLKEGEGTVQGHDIKK